MPAAPVAAAATVAARQPDQCPFVSNELGDSEHQLRLEHAGSGLVAAPSQAQPTWLVHAACLPVPKPMDEHDIT